MGKWAVETKKEQSIPPLLMSVFGLIGIGMLVLVFAGMAVSAPTFPGGPSVFGHKIDDLIAAGEFYGDSASQTVFPGYMWVRGYAGIGTAPVSTTALSVASGVLNNVGLSVTTNNSRVADFISTHVGNSVQIALKTSAGNEWRLGTNIAPATANEFVIRNNVTGHNAITLSPIPGGTNVGINATDPVHQLDVQGDIQATQDICTSLNGGTCLSEANDDIGAPTAGIRVVCSGGSCSNAILGAVSGSLETGCPAGTIPISCSGVVDAGAGQTLRKLGYKSLFGTYADDGASTSLPGNPPGCQMTWQTTGGSPTGYVVAYCAPIGT
jgi:hypothetical protein